MHTTKISPHHLRTEGYGRISPVCGTFSAHLGNGGSARFGGRSSLVGKTGVIKLLDIGGFLETQEQETRREVPGVGSVPRT